MRLTKSWSTALRRRKMKRTNELQESVKFNQRSVAVVGHAVKLYKGFLGYGRAAELMFFKRKRSTTLKAPNAHAIAWGQKQSRKKKHKNVRWYTRVYHGAQRRLIEDVMYGLSDFKRKVIAEQLKQNPFANQGSRSKPVLPDE